MTIHQAYMEGMRSMQEGDVAEARRLFELVLANDPRHRGAQMQLKMLREREVAARGMEARLSAIIIPEINFESVSLNAAIDFLSQEAARRSAEGEPINFVRMFPRELGEGREIDLRLTNIPLGEAMRYVGDMAGVRFLPDQYAVRVVPLGGTDNAGAAAPDN